MDFTTVTETWGLAASPEQVAMAYARYKLAGDLADGKRVLEVGCGSGMGLAYLQQRASQVVGGDRTLTLLQAARDRLDSLALVCLDAHELPFSSSSFDVVLMLEMVITSANRSEPLLSAGGCYDRAESCSSAHDPEKPVCAAPAWNLPQSNEVSSRTPRPSASDAPDDERRSSP